MAGVPPRLKGLGKRNGSKSVVPSEAGKGVGPRKRPEGQGASSPHVTEPEGAEEDAAADPERGGVVLDRRRSCVGRDVRGPGSAAPISRQCRVSLPLPGA